MPQLVDHAHIDYCAAIGYNLVQLRRKITCLFLVAVTVNNALLVLRA